MGTVALRTGQASRVHSRETIFFIPRSIPAGASFFLTGGILGPAGAGPPISDNPRSPAGPRTVARAGSLTIHPGAGSIHPAPTPKNRPGGRPTRIPGRKE